MPKLTFPILLIALAVALLPVGVGAITSTSYQLFPEQGYQAPTEDGSSTTSDRLQSTSYQMHGSLDSYVGRLTSSSYRQNSGAASFQYYCGDGFIDPGETCDGADLNGATCVSQGFASGTLTCSSACALVTSACNSSSSGGGGGGGGGGAAPVSAPSAPSVSDAIKSLAFSYKPTFLLYGTTSAAVTSVKVNGSADGVTLPTSTSWQKTLSLSYGLNTFKIIATNTGGSSTESVFELYRRLTGDITQDNKVNDYDLSKLVKLWGGSDRNGDFNEDKSVNDYDFSMMVARWGTAV